MLASTDLPRIHSSVCFKAMNISLQEGCAHSQIVSTAVSTMMLRNQVFIFRGCYRRVRKAVSLDLTYRYLLPVDRR